MTQCACGCGGEIIIKKYHKYYGIPKYIQGHGSKIKEFKEKISILSSERFKGKPKSDEHKKKISETRIKKEISKGENNPMYGVKRFGENNPFYGKHHTEETKKKIKEGLVEKYYGKDSEEYRNKLSEAHRGLMLGENNPMFGIHLKFLEDRKNKYRVMFSGNKNPNFGIHRKGELSGNWKGGVTPLNEQIRHCDKYNGWVKNIYERDNYTCQECGKHGGNMNAHHIKLFSKIIEENNIKVFEASQNCDELWDLKNGVTLCVKCHKKTFKKS